MKQLATKYTKLKRLIGGNREKMGYEETFGIPQEELYYITMPNRWIRRILGEIEFAIRLSSACENKYDDLLNTTLDLLINEVTAEGVLTKTLCFKAEDMLTPIKEDAKSYRLILASHAHIDMNWMWSFNETVAITLSTFRTILNIMDEYPHYCFSQSQASVYKIVQDYDPELMERIKARIKEGRWEVSATAWVETDKNMPNTESLLRHIKYTRDYLRDNWDIDPNTLELDFSPDTFGHNGNVPEINSYGNVKYYYHCRALDGKQALYRYKSPSGKEVLVYREQYWYNSGITPHIGAGLIDISKRCAGFKTGLIVYGVGNHGGGPTRRDVERAIDMMDWPIYPTIKFGTITEFFKEAESVRDKLEVVDHELNYFAPGCYTTQSRIKLGNRRCEAALLDAEAVGVIARTIAPFNYRKDQFIKAWRDVLFTHFHDILTGSCVQDSREHAMGLFQTSMAVANTNYQNALRVISENIDTSSIKEDRDSYNSQSFGGGGGFGIENFSGVPNTELGSGKTRIFHIFNPTATVRTESVELTVWDWVGDMRYIAVNKPDGTPVDFQLLSTKQENYWDHKYMKLLVNVTVPPLGYTTVVLNESDPDEYRIYYQNDIRSSHPYQDFTLENKYICAKFNCSNGMMYSLFDKVNGIETIKDGSFAGFNLIDTEKNTSSAWDIGRHLRSTPISQVKEIRKTSSGNLQNGFTVVYSVSRSTITANVTLDKDSHSVRYQTTVDWHEVGAETVPVLNFTLPVSYTAKRYLYDIPAGAIYRDSMQIDVPALQYGCAVNDTPSSAFIVTDCKYGYRGVNSTISSTLINSATSPDKYPERGIHHINLHVGVLESSPKVIGEYATTLNHPLCYHSSNSHKGTLPLESSLFSFDSETAVISCVTSSDDGSILVRVYETCGKDSGVSLTFNSPVISAKHVNLMEDTVSSPIEVNESKVNFVVKPNCICGIKITL